MCCLGVQGASVGWEGVLHKWGELQAKLWQDSCWLPQEAFRSEVRTCRVGPVLVLSEDVLFVMWVVVVFFLVCT